MQVKAISWLWYHTSVLLSAVKRMWEKYIMKVRKRKERKSIKRNDSVYGSQTSESLLMSWVEWASLLERDTHTHTLLIQTHNLSQCMDASKQLPWIMRKFNDTHINTHSWPMLGDGNPKWHHPERQGALFGYCHSIKAPEGDAPPHPCASQIQNKGWEKRQCEICRGHQLKALKMHWWQKLLKKAR